MASDDFEAVSWLILWSYSKGNESCRVYGVVILSTCFVFVSFALSFCRVICSNSVILLMPHKLYITYAISSQRRGIKHCYTEGERDTHRAQAFQQRDPSYSIWHTQHLRVWLSYFVQHGTDLVTKLKTCMLSRQVGNEKNNLPFDQCLPSCSFHVVDN